MTQWKLCVKIERNKLLQATGQITFADSAENFALSGKNDEYLKEIENSFDCRMTARGGKVDFFGKDAATAVAILGELQKFYRGGGAVSLHEVKYAVRLAKESNIKSMGALLSDTILVTSKGKHIRPKTLGQKNYLDAMRRNEVVFGIGPAGTGKTYLAVVMAAAALRKKTAERLILTRPAVEAGEHLGFLPGDLQEKVDPYLRPLYDALMDILGAELFQKFTARGIIEIAPLAYMRGRTLSDAFIILDEAQNTTERQMKMFLTRLGFNSRMVITGDLSQIDLPRGSLSGLSLAAQILSDVAGVSVCRLDNSDVVRSPMVGRIVAAYERYEAQKESAKNPV